MEPDFPQTSAREKLKEERKIRNKQKKEQKRVEKRMERERKALQALVAPKDQKVTIITREQADNVSEQKQQPSQPSPELNNDEFPFLGQQKPRQRSRNTTGSSMDSVDVTSRDAGKTMSKPTKNSSIEVTILDIVNKKSTTPVLIETKMKNEPKYEGNILDASNPERKRGKHRTGPPDKARSKLKQAISKERDELNNSDTTVENKGYCDNVITVELDNSVDALLTNVVRFQERMYKRDQIKGVAKRRYMVGLREVKKYLALGKLQMIIIAPDLRECTENGTLHNIIKDLTDLAVKNEVPYVFALKRRIIGKITLKFIPVSCVGIINFQGAEEEYYTVIKYLNEARKLYKLEHPETINPGSELSKQLADVLLHALKN